MRFRPRLERLLSLLITFSYLGVCLVDCESWAGRPEPVEQSAQPHHRSAHGELRAPHHAEPSGHGVAPHHNEPTGHAPGQPRHSDTAVHGHHHAQVDQATSNESTASSREGRLTMRPTCLCGCSETRSLAGGNASRVGVVVPGVSVAVLVVYPPMRGTTTQRVCWQEGFGPDDPIPI